LIALIINAHPSSVRRWDPRRIPATRYVTADGRYEFAFASIEHRLERPILASQDRTDGEAVKLRRQSIAQPQPMDEGQDQTTPLGARRTSRPAAAHVRSERSPLHDVRQHAHANGPWRDAAHARFHFFTDERLRRIARLR